VKLLADYVSNFVVVLFSSVLFLSADRFHRDVPHISTASMGVGSVDSH